MRRKYRSFSDYENFGEKWFNETSVGFKLKEWQKIGKSFEDFSGTWFGDPKLGLKARARLFIKRK
jgi:hypothetical protein